MEVNGYQFPAFFFFKMSCFVFNRRRKLIKFQNKRESKWWENFHFGWTSICHYLLILHLLFSEWYFRIFWYPNSFIGQLLWYLMVKINWNYKSMVTSHQSWKWITLLKAPKIQMDSGHPQRGLNLFFSSFFKRYLKECGNKSPLAITGKIKIYDGSQWIVFFQQNAQFLGELSL